MMRDIRLGLRRLLGTPGFTAVAILTLGFGIGANTAIFTIVNKALLKPLPVKDASEIIALSNASNDGRMFPAFSYLNYVDLRAISDSAVNLMAYAPTPVSLSHDGVNERVWGYIVSGNYFDVLGLRPSVGRLISTDDDVAPGSHPLSVISYDAWRRRFGADPEIVGRDILVNGRKFTVIGVAPPDFVGVEVAFTAEIWFPMMMQSEISPGSRWQTNRSFENLYVDGRIRRGTSESSVRAVLRSAAADLARQFPNENQGKTIEISPAGLFGTMGRGVMMGVSGVMMAAVALVLLLVCTNLINLCLARSAYRQREIFVQQALGASRGRVMRQLLTESFLLSGAGGGVGLLVAYWFTTAASRFRLPLDIPLSFEFSLDWRVLVFTAAISIAAGAGFGLLPAWQSSAAVNASLRPKSRMRNVLVAAQVSLSLVLMIFAGLSLRSLQHAQFVDLGINPENAVETGFDLNLQGYSRERRSQFVRDLLDRVGGLPGIVAAGVGTGVPPDPHIASAVIRIEGAPPPERGTAPRAIFASVTPEYRQALGMTLLSGRDFADRDNESSPLVGIVNETFARRFWNGDDPLGKRFAIGESGDAWFQVVGIVRDGKYRSLGESPSPFAMVPLFQSNSGLLRIVARSSPRNGNRLEDVRREIEALDPNLPVFDSRSLTEHMRLPLFPATIAAVMFGSFGTLALVIAALGIFGVVSFTVSRRTQEIGIRMALGASRASVIRLILRQGMFPVAVGMALGFFCCLVLSPVIEMGEILYGISETDPVSFGAILMVLGVVALLACYLPARRASKVDPLVALRRE
jgi:putative ABC transport system permease protein